MTKSIFIKDDSFKCGGAKSETEQLHQGPVWDK